MILDAYPVLALLLAEPAGPAVEKLLRSDAPVAMTCVGQAEATDRVLRAGDVSPIEFAADLARLGLEPSIPLDPATAFTAGRLRADHYHRTSRPVSLADCVAAATASKQRRPLVTSDRHLLDLCRDEAIAVHPLPDSQGRRWNGTTS